MAVTTAPNVFCTASPTFRAISVPPSSSACASVTSADNDKEKPSALSHFPKENSEGRAERFWVLLQVPLCCPATTPGAGLRVRWHLLVLYLNPPELPYNLSLK